MAEALWKTMGEREMSMEDALDVCAMIMMGVGKYAPASNEELVCRLEDKLSKLNPEQ